MGSEMIMDGFKGFQPPDRFTQSKPKDLDEATRQKLEQRQKFAQTSANIASTIADNVLAHPLILLRRQCQVNPVCRWYHWTPFTLIPVMYNLNRHQGIISQWKGIGSTFIVKGMTLVAENAISEITPLPKDVTCRSSLKKMGQHFLLKAISCTLMVPFHAACVVETVQSEIASERPGVFDVLKEGLYRIMGSSTSVHTTRTLPVWKLIFPSIFHSLGHYCVSSFTQYLVLIVIQNKQDVETDQNRQSLHQQYFPELMASFSGALLADVMLFPIETIINRLLIQGTRTIVDNMDNGLEVIPITTYYEGFFDCLKSIMMEEGLGALYKGFGALILQYTVHFSILKITSVMFERFTDDILTARRR